MADTPQDILTAGLTDHTGSLYQYQDAVTDVSTYAVGSNDGGVIAGAVG